MSEIEFTWTVAEEKKERSADWYWILGVFAVALCIIGFLLDNLLFSLLTLLATGVIVLISHHDHAPVTYSVSLRGVEVNETLYPFRSLHAFHVDRSDREQFFLRLKSDHIFAPLSSIPIHKELTVDVEKLLAAYVKEEHIEEPIGNRIFTIIGL
jgi:hypothetical protein